MKITYSIDENDYLTFQLFSASNSAVLKKRRFISRLVPAIAYLLLAVTFFYQGNITMIIAFCLLAVVWYFLYPFHDKNVYKRQYQKFIKENMNNKFGRPATLSFEAPMVKAKDEVSETKINYSEIESITEIPEMFLLKLKTNQSFILPKDKIENWETLNSFFESFEANEGVPFYVLSNWKWK